jgi:hypothetical protein
MTWIKVATADPFFNVRGSPTVPARRSPAVVAVQQPW